VYNLVFPSATQGGKPFIPGDGLVYRRALLDHIERGCVEPRSRFPAMHNGNRLRLVAGLGFEIFPREQQTPEALGALQKADIEKGWPIIKAANVKFE
jgi:hypothetical protein